MKLCKFTAIAVCLSFMMEICVCAKTVSADEDTADLNSPIECSAVDLSLGADLKINAKSAVLMEPHTGDVLYEQNSAEKMPPASITKIMSLILITEAIEKNQLSTEEVITASDYASSMGGSQIWLKPGESMTVDDLMKATVVASANDATVALAEKVAGSEETFVSKMNEKARELGMNDTCFKNCTGLDVEGHFSSAYDVALMSCELLKHPIIKRYSTLWIERIRNGESELVNTNKLVRFYEGTTGLKTGTTSGAGYCLSASAKRGDTEYVAVIMGGNSSNDRFAGAKKLLDFGFANYRLEEISGDLGKKTKVRCENGTEKYIKARAGKSVKILIKNQDKGKIKKHLRYDEKIKAPIKKGEKIGEIQIYIGDEQVGIIPIFAENSVSKLNFCNSFFRIAAGLFKL